MSNDREEVPIMSLDWTTPEYLANLAAEELGHAMAMRGIGWTTCFGDEDGVSVSLHGIKDAETLMTLAVPGPTGPGTLYDRATGCCVTLGALAQAAGGSSDVPEEQLAAAFAAGWTWMIHPDMIGHVPNWHVSVTMPTGDANAVTARLNALPFTDDAA